MERRAQPKKRYLSASYVTSGAVFYGTLLFLIARIFSLFQLFGDAYTRNKLEQAPPENFTVFGIVGSLLIIGVIGLAFFLLFQNRQKKLKMKRGNLYLLLNTLFIIWGVINAVSNLIDMIVFFEFVYLLDFVALIAAIIIPSVLLQLTDRRQDVPRDTVLLVAAIGATALSIIALLIVVLFLRGGYKDTPFALVIELIYRAGLILFSIGGLIKALKIRRELPELVAAVMKAGPKPSPAPKQKAAAKAKVKTSRSGKIECPDCGKKVAAGTQVCPRCGFDLTTPSLFDDEDDDLPPEEPDDEETYYDEPEPEEPAEQTEPEPPPEPVRNDICPRCGKHKPPFLSTCPRCGYFPGDPTEPEPEEPAEPQRPAAPTTAGSPAAPQVEQKQERRCEQCGKRIPGGLTTCPYCGFHPDDAKRPPEPPPLENLFDDEPEPEMLPCPRCGRDVVEGTQVCPHCGYPFPDRQETGRIQRPTQRLPRVPYPKHRNEKNSINCPECGRRYSAARSVCPYCGYDLYND